MGKQLLCGGLESPDPFHTSEGVGDFIVGNGRITGKVEGGIEAECTTVYTITLCMLVNLGQPQSFMDKSDASPFFLLLPAV